MKHRLYGKVLSDARQPIYKLTQLGVLDILDLITGWYLCL